MGKGAGGGKGLPLTPSQIIGGPAPPPPSSYAYVYVKKKYISFFWPSSEVKFWVLRPFQAYFTFIEPIVNQRWAKTGVPGEN